MTGTSLTPPNNKIRKISRSTDKYVPFFYEENPFDVIRKIKSEEYTILSLEITTSSIDVCELSLHQDEKICIVLGSEKYGISQELLRESDITVHILMRGKIHP